MVTWHALGGLGLILAGLGVGTVGVVSILAGAASPVGDESLGTKGCAGVIAAIFMICIGLYGLVH